jgi:hypothetical protein
MGLGHLTSCRAITKLGRSNSLHLFDDNPALTFIQEPVSGARQRSGSPHHVGTIANRQDWLDAVQSFLCLLLTAF